MTLHLLRPGMMTTVQDGGRWGYQSLGVPVSGPMDWYSHRAANRLVGNEDGAATLEVTLIGPEIEFDADVVLAVVGAEFDLALDGRTLSPAAAHAAGARSRLRFGTRRRGARAYLAVRGGLSVPTVLGSRSTHLVSGLGGFEGRALRAGDRLSVGVADESPRPGASAPLPLPAGGARLRVLPGPQLDRFEPQAIDRLCASRYRITPQSDRMGYRLEGPALRAHSPDIISDATLPGAIQVPASGQPILLMADRQTTGGYPKIGVVITADLPVAGQLAPGDWIEFETCDRASAIRALRALDDASRRSA